MMHHIGIQPSEIDNMEAYRFEEYKLHLKKFLENKKKAHDDAEAQQQKKSSGFKMPRFKMPKLR